MKHRVLSLVALAGVLMLAAQLPAAATDAAPSRESRTQVQSAHWPAFHARLGSMKRADCVTTGRRQKLQLRCDRYDRQAGQEVSVTIVDGKARRLVDPSDATGDPVGSRLRADHVWRRGPVRCRATGSSLRCRDVNSQHGFVMTGQRLRVF
jgi:hypothetical protein